MNQDSLAGRLSGPQRASAVSRTTLRPSRGWVAIDFRELLRFRDLLVVLAGRDVKLRYKQTALGVSWVLIQPLIAAGLFSFVFGTVAGLKTTGVPYFAFSFAGLLAWILCTGFLCAKRLRARTHAPGHVAEMIVTSVVIPFLSVFWRLAGALKFHVFYY